MQRLYSQSAIYPNSECVNKWIYKCIMWLAGVNKASLNSENQNDDLVFTKKKQSAEVVFLLSSWSVCFELE